MRSLLLLVLLPLLPTLGCELAVGRLGRAVMYEGGMLGVGAEEDEEMVEMVEDLWKGEGTVMGVKVPMAIWDSGTTVVGEVMVMV